MTGNNPRYAVLVPGADSLTFEEDRAEAARHNIEARELTLPPFSGHPIDDLTAHFDAVADLFVDAIKTIRDEEPAARIAAVGRNNGGGQVAWALARKITVNAVVLVGAIPEISLYRKQSDSDSAVKFRKSLGNEAELARIDEMRPLDIIFSAKKWAITNCLMQLGHNDPYIDETATDAAASLAERFRVEWLDDDHAMVSQESLQQRWDYIDEVLKAI